MAADPTSAQRAGSDGAAPIRREDVIVWLASLAGALAWMLQLVVNFCLTPHARAAHSTLAMHLVSLCALLVSLAAAAVCIGTVRRHGAIPAAKTRDAFVAYCGAALDLFFALVILAQELPTWLHHLGD